MICGNKKGTRSAGLFYKIPLTMRFLLGLTEHMRNMKRNLLAGALLAAACAAYYLSLGMETAEVLRKLSGMRLSIEFYRQQYKRLPASFGETLSAGTLEEAPALKLSRHLERQQVTDVPAMRIRDTGGWAYVNDPADRAFGLLYIDCSHLDAKGRSWSEF